jgi:hypothetical protein
MMTTQERAPLPVPTPETMDLWSRQMLEMQKLLMQPSLAPDYLSITPVVDEDDDEDLWDNLPV